jgi:hypothetical protein
MVDTQNSSKIERVTWMQYENRTKCSGTTHYTAILEAI